MERNLIISALAGAALAVSGPALAKPGGGGGHGKGGAKAGATANVGGAGNSANAIGGDISVGSSISTRGGGNAMGQGKLSAGSAIDMRGSTSARTKTNVTGSAGANLRGMGQASASLIDVIDGMTVVDSGGATVGTVTGIHTVGNGKVRSVQVTLTNGQIITLSPKSLVVDGDQLVTASLTTDVRSQGAANANINGLINASPNSVLAQAGVNIPGLVAGLVVNNSGGTAIGTVDSLILNRAGAVVAIRVDLDGGGTVLVPATSLRLIGGIVTTTHINGGG